MNEYYLIYILMDVYMYGSNLINNAGLYLT